MIDNNNNNYEISPMSEVEIINYANHIRGLCKDFGLDFNIVKHLIDQPIEALGVSVLIENDSEFDPGVEAFTEPFEPLIHFRKSYFDALTDPFFTNPRLYVRAKFTLAHELMHALKHVIKNPLNGALYRKKATRYTPYSQRTESQANQFAAALLLYSKRFLDLFKFREVREVAQICRVSIAATDIQMRLYRKLEMQNPSNAATLLGL